jgi:hypothetical protein
MEQGLRQEDEMDEYKVQGRGGSGIKTAEVTPKTGEIIGAKVLTGDEEGRGDRRHLEEGPGHPHEPARSRPFRARRRACAS